MSARSRLADAGRRIILTLTIAAVSASIAWVCGGIRQLPSDFEHVPVAARFLLHGINPYTAIGPRGLFRFDFPLLYPLPAVVATIPLAGLPARWAETIFLGLGAGALAWALTRRRLANPQLCVFASFAFLTIAANVQWSLLLTAAALLPGLGVLLACKPTLGLALFAAYPSRRTAIAAGLFGLATVVIWPWWVAAWLTTIRTQTHLIAPVTLLTAGGPLVLLALARWRRPEARLLVALACVPHSPVLYETIALFLIVETWTEGALLVALTTGLFLLQGQCGPGMDFHAWLRHAAQWQVAVVYLPCLLLILRRPNAAPVTVADQDAETVVRGDAHVLAA
jgi:hypothetical protein